MKRFFLFIGLCLSSCANLEFPPVAVTDVTLDTEQIELSVGESRKLTATISPSDATNQKVIWFSSDASIAEVIEGVVIANKIGTSRITVKTDDGSKTATCNVIVKENGENISTQKITLSQQTINVGFEPYTYEISVTSPCSWIAEAKNDWLIIESQTGIAGTEVLSFRVEHNDGEKERKGTIVIKNSDYNLIAELYVIQQEFIPSISYEFENLSFSMEGGEQFVKISANVEYDAISSAEWLTIIKNKDGYTISAPSHYETDDRTAEIVITNEKYGITKTLQVSQYGIGDDKILYTSSDNSVIQPSELFISANIVSNTYENGKGIIQFDKALTEVVNSAFYGSQNLTSVLIPKSVTRIGTEAFAFCENLENVTMSENVIHIDEWAFIACSKLKNIIIPDTVISIGHSAFGSCASLESVTIPESVNSIGKSAFADCTNLSEFKGKFASDDGRCLVVDGVLNSFAFAGLTEYITPKNVTSIGIYAFTGRSGLKKVTISEGVTEIGYRAFVECITIETVIIPESVTTIGEDAFGSCWRLENVYCRPVCPPTGNMDMFFDNASNRKIYVPTASVEAYKAKEFWRNYSEDIIGYSF